LAKEVHIERSQAAFTQESRDKRKHSLRELRLNGPTRLALPVPEDYAAKAFDSHSPSFACLKLKSMLESK